MDLDDAVSAQQNGTQAGKTEWGGNKVVIASPRLATQRARDEDRDRHLKGPGRKTSQIGGGKSGMDARRHVPVDKNSNVLATSKSPSRNAVSDRRSGAQNPALNTTTTANLGKPDVSDNKEEDEVSRLLKDEDSMLAITIARAEAAEREACKRRDEVRMKEGGGGLPLSTTPFHPRPKGQRRHLFRLFRPRQRLLLVQ